MFQRPSLLSSYCPTAVTKTDDIFNYYQSAAGYLLGTEINPKMLQCPLSERVCSLVRRLKAFTIPETMVHDSWLLFFPLLVQHRACSLCTPGTQSLSELMNLVLKAAAALVNISHDTVKAGSIMRPPLLMVPRTFAAGCVLIVGKIKSWPDSGTTTDALFKCSEVLLFCAPLCNGGREYHEMWRGLVSVL